MNYNFDDRIQVKPFHRASVGTVAGDKKKTKLRVVVRISKYVSFSKEGKYLVRISRKGFNVNKSGFNTLAEAEAYRDEKLKNFTPLPDARKKHYKSKY